MIGLLTLSIAEAEHWGRALVRNSGGDADRARLSELAGLLVVVPHDLVDPVALRRTIADVDARYRGIIEILGRNANVDPDPSQDEIRAATQAAVSLKIELQDLVWELGRRSIPAEPPGDNR